MKKIFVFIISVIFFLSAKSYAYSELYYLKNINKHTVLSQIKSILTEKNFILKKEDPIYTVSAKNSSNYAVIVLTPSGNNLFYYYEANDKNTKLNNDILKSFKRNNYIYEQSYNQTHLSSFAKTASKVLSGENNQYTFSETPYIQQEIQSVQQPIQIQFPTNTQQNIQQNVQYNTTSNPFNNYTLNGTVCVIPKGTKLNIYIQNSLNTTTSKAGDQIIGVLNGDWLYNGQIIAHAGSVLYGQVTKAKAASIGLSNGVIEFAFNRMETPQGRNHNISTEAVIFNVTEEGRVTRVFSSIAKDASLGVLLGAAIASSTKQGALIGAGIGTALALLTNLAQKGSDAEIPAYTEIEIELDKPLTIILN